MSQTDKIVEYHISRLKDRNPDVQVSTCRELELLGDRAESALSALEQLHNSTTNEDVRLAAQRAGLIIFKAVKSRSK